MSMVEASDRWHNPVPPDPEEEPEELGPCGCTDYHMADCPTRDPYRDEAQYEED